MDFAKPRKVQGKCFFPALFLISISNTLLVIFGVMIKPMVIPVKDNIKAAFHPTGFVINKKLKPEIETIANAIKAMYVVD